MNFLTLEIRTDNSTDDLEGNGGNEPPTKKRKILGLMDILPSPEDEPAITAIAACSKELDDNLNPPSGAIDDEARKSNSAENDQVGR